MLSGFTSYALFTDTVISNNIITLGISNKNYSKEFTYKGECEEYIVPYNGYYKIEAWGAQGGYGYSTTYYGGGGGYASGITKLIKGETLYICVGGKGNDTTTKGYDVRLGGFNGGANTIGNEVKYTGSAGGATDIRLVSGSWDNEEGLNSRIMVAGGGGAGGYESLSYYSTGGVGGNLIGGTGVSIYTVSSEYVTVGTGGAQTSGGTGYATGSFGKGGASSSDYIGGAGGYYGGGAGKYTSGSGGGSSFISGYAGVNAITSSTDRTHTNNTLHYSNKYFINTEMKSGVRTGNGKAVITYVSSTKPERTNTSLNNVRYIKDCTTGSDANENKAWEEIQAIYNGVNVALGKSVTGTGTIYSSTSGKWSYSAVTDGNINNNNGDDAYTTDTGNQCVTVDLGQTYDLDEIAVWHYWESGRTCTDNYTYVSSDNTNWIKAMDKQEKETSQGKRVSAYEGTSYIFNYTGTCEEFTVEKTGYYRIEAYGASGGGTKAGLGGYTSGVTKLLNGETLYVCVGGKGNANSTVTNVGGFNGGGYSDNYSTTYSYGGGGATDIRLVGGNWNSEEGLNSRLMVASGGAGTTYYVGTTAGSGGGLIGENGTTDISHYNTSTYLPTGGTQTFGGSAYVDEEDDTENDVRSGYFGYAPQSNTRGYAGGGGSGYYGGGNGFGTTGSGGSSFISGYAGVNAITSSSDRTHTNNTLHYSGKYFINTEMKSGVRTGNGKAVITYISEERPERTNTSLNNVRYIKDCINGNSETTSNHWLELQAIYNGTNVALSKTVTSTGTINDEYGTGLITSIVDGNILSDNFARFNSGNQCVTVDLGQTYDLDEIAVWHYWATGRTYNDNYTYVSSDNETWIKVIDRQEPETSQGKRVNAYEGTSLTIKQNTGGLLTCINDTTGVSSTTSLPVTKGDVITCNVSESSGYRSTSLKIESDSITSGTSFTYDYDLSKIITPTYYKYCSQTEAYSYGSWSSCSASCGGGTQTRTVYYRDKNYTSYTSCGTSTQSQSCNTQSCVVTCDCMYRTSTYKSVPQWYHSVCGSYHSTAYLRLCKCSNGGVYNCYDSGWTSYAGETYGSACYVHTGYNAYTGLDYSWSNYPGSYW